MVEQTANKLKWLGERAAAAMAIVTITSLAFGFIWTFAKNEIVHFVADATGVPELTKEVRETAERTQDSVDRLTVIIEATAARVAEFHPPKIVEYDELLSRIFSPCPSGGDCEVQLRVRRTPFGVACGLPEVIGRVVTDRSGLDHPVQPPQRTQPQRLDGEWAMRPIIFTVPPRVPLGVASFHMVLEYECDGATVVEETPRLPFEIIGE